MSYFIINAEFRNEAFQFKILSSHIQSHIFFNLYIYIRYFSNLIQSIVYL